MEIDPPAAGFTPPHRGLFASRGRALIGLVIYTAILYSSLNITYDLYVAVFDRIGRGRMSLLVNSFYALLAIALFVFLRRRVKRSVGAYLAFLAILVTVAVFLRTEPIPANRIHFVQYAPLTILALEVHRFQWRGLRLQAASLGTVFVIGCGDEFLQSLLSSRHFDLHDVLLNTVAAVLALVFVGLVVGSGNDPWGSASRTARRRQDGNGNHDRLME